MRSAPLALSLVLVLAASALLAGCGDCVRCDKEQDRTLSEWGPPDETESRRDGHLITETWFYWERDRSVVFLWDERDCSCSVNEYSFEEGASPEPLSRAETSGAPRHQQLGPQ